MTEAPPPPPHASPGAAVAPAVGARPRRSGLVVATAIILLIVGVGGAIYNSWDLVVLAGDLGLAQEVGVADRFLILIAIDVGLTLMGIIQLVAGIQLLAAGRAGRIAGIVSSLVVVALWIASLLFVTGWDLTLRPHAWAVLILALAGSLLAAIFLMASPARSLRDEPR